MSKSGKKSYKGIKICCAATALVLTIILVTLTVLFLTLLKPKEPQIHPYPVNLTHIYYGVFPVAKLEATLKLEVSINNPNYGSFEYKNTTAYLYYHGEDVGEAPIKGDTTPARGKQNISTSINVMGEKMLLDPNISVDLNIGIFNFTSITIMHGKVSVFKLLKLHATALCTCDMSIFLKSRTAHSECKSRVTF